MIVVLAVLGSGIGAVARYLLAGAVQRRSGGYHPWGTAVVNVSGAVLLGVLTGLYASGRLGPDLLTVLGAGFCGGFTTFSTWMIESVRLGEEGGTSGLVALTGNVTLQLVAGIMGAGLGLQIA